MEYVILKDTEKSVNVPVKNGGISLETIQAGFHQALGISFKKNKETHLVEKIQNIFKVVNGVSEYEVFYPASSKDGK